MPPRPVGIDLGTTYSVVAAVNEAGEAVPIPNEDGERLTPSVVYFPDEGQPIVGADAKDRGIIEPDSVVTAIKRQMGTDITRRFGSASFTPEGISAIILDSLARGAAPALGVSPEDLDAVITVPAYFGSREREATALAAGIAGLSLMELVDEPVAAAISYGVDTGASGLVLVYDLGGGTFDTTVLELSEHGPGVLITDGLSQMGGLDWDERLSGFIIERAAEIVGDPDLADDDDLMLQVAHSAERAKRQLSTREATTVTLHLPDNRVTVHVRRDDFEALCRELVMATMEVVERTIEEAGNKSRSSLTEIILVGGSTHMPMIGAALRRRFDVRVHLRDPDLAIAKGAALHAAALNRARNPQRFLSSDTSEGSSKSSRGLALKPSAGVLPRALGILLHDSHDPNGTRQFVHHLLEPNTPLPVVSQSATYATILNNQREIRVQLYEQAGSRPSEEVVNNRRVLDGQLTDLPDLKAGSPVEVSVSVSTDGRISCTATEPTSGRQLTIESYMDGVVDSAEAQQQQQAVSRLTRGG